MERNCDCHHPESLHGHAVTIPGATWTGCRDDDCICDEFQWNGDLGGVPVTRSRSSDGSEHRTSNSAVAGSSPAGNANVYYPPGHYPVGDALPLDACIHCRCRPCNCASPAH